MAHFFIDIHRFPAEKEKLIINPRQDSFPKYYGKAIIENYKLSNPVEVESGWSSKNLLEEFIKKNFNPVIDKKGQRVYFTISNTGNIELIKKREVPSHVISVLMGFGSTQSMSNELKKINIEFEFPKPIKLIEYIIDFYCNKQDIVLDAFAGTGVVANAVLSLNKNDNGNRKFILIEREKYAETITAERVRKIIRGYTISEVIKKELFVKKINVSDLKNNKLYNDIQIFIEKEKLNFDKIETKIDSGILKIMGTLSKDSFVVGIPGDFSYYEIGEPLLDGDVLNPRVAVEKIRAYIWYMETRQPYQKPVADNEAFLGQENGTAYYFHYDPAQRRLLDEEFLRSITTRAEHYVIYADECLLSEAFLQKHAITFKKIPRDIARL